MLIEFKKIWEDKMRYFTLEGKVRMRKYTPRSNGILTQVEDKLLFILYYLKVHPVQESLAASFDMTQPQANRYIHLCKEVLYRALQNKGCLPVRSAVDLKKRLGEQPDDFYTDGVERAVPRSVDKEVQKEYYSGKKKMHTIKHTIFSGADATIHFLSNWYEGNTHDKRINEQEQVCLPDGSRCFQDTGFVGYCPEGNDIEVIMPVKKPRGGQLTEQQKQENTQISRVRVRVEHVMSGIKRLRIIKDKIRVWANDFRDQAMEIACGLHNFRLAFRPWKYPDPDKILQT